MNRDVGILINSHINGNTALEWLLKSMNDVKLRILVVIGGAKENICCKHVNNNVYKCYVKHNSIDMTGMICLLENNREIEQIMNGLPKRWFYIHDTCEITDRDLFVRRCIETKETTRLVTKRPSMNIGMYSYEDILRTKEMILKKKSKEKNMTRQEIEEQKKDVIRCEDMLFKKLMIKSGMSEVETLQEKFVYPSSNVQRIIEVYKDVGLKKYKANYCGLGGKVILDN